MLLLILCNLNISVSRVLQQCYQGQVYIEYECDFCISPGQTISSNKGFAFRVSVFNETTMVFNPIKKG